jgi:hypothetical protein
LIMPLALRMSFASAARAAFAGMDRFGWHRSNSSLFSWMLALSANPPLDRKSSKNPELIVLQPLSSRAAAVGLRHQP